ncbi:MAG: aspartate/glutamate/uridylate kinase [Gammaproteobacteria bacterium]|nr:aspartate/glutamate/uridylate kinase [Gammaproteobacteria bacterium]
MPKSPTWVVKLGGSLWRSPQLREWLSVLATSTRSCVIVPGGGCFVGAVAATQAHWRYSDNAAHQMAMLSMAQYGLMLGALEPRLRVTDFASLAVGGDPAGSCVYLPTLADCTAMENLPWDWSVSADSVALWLAGAIDATALVLLKARPPARDATDSAALAVEGFIDRHFALLQRRVNLPVIWFASGEVGRFQGALQLGEFNFPDRLIKETLNKSLLDFSE